MPSAALAKIYLDVEPGREPKGGEFVVTAGRRGFGSAYLIVRAKRSAKRADRFYLTCQRGYTVADALAGAGWWTLTWYHRGRRRLPRV